MIVRYVLMYLLLIPVIASARSLISYQDENGATIFSDKNIDGLKKISEKKYEDTISKWNLKCDKDRFNRSKICSLSKDTILVMLKDGVYTVSVGRLHFPKSKSAIKIDDNVTIYGYEGLSQYPNKVIKQLLNGKRLFTRYQEWPYQFNRDDEIDLHGFSEKFEEMKELYGQL